MAINFLELIAGTSVDLKPFEEGMKKAEEKAEETAKRITESWNLVGIGIATAIGGAVLLALEKATKETAEWGLEMEHLSNRMGVTTKEAATLVGVMERFGVNSNAGARAMQMLSSQVRQTQESLDPFATRLGKVLGTLRDTNGHALNMSQVLDLVRQKVSGASSDTERLQIATGLLGSRIGGQLVPMLKLNNEEWERQRAAVEATLGPVDKAAEEALAYKQATAELQQTFRGLEIEIGTKILPALIDISHYMTQFIQDVNNGKSMLPSILAWVSGFTLLKTSIEEGTHAFLWFEEKVGIVAKGTAENFSHMKQFQEEARKAALEKDKESQAQEDLNNEISQSEQNERKIVATAKEYVSLMEKARSQGALGVTEAATRLELEKALERFTEQRVLLEGELNKNVTGEQRERIEKDILKNRMDAAKLVSDFATEGYKQEELQLKSLGAYSIGNEIELLQRKLNDERIVGDERLKIEGELYQKRKQYTESAVKEARALGLLSVDQEIAYRKQRAAESLDKGDVIGAAQELAKIRDLAFKQADQVMEYVKKIRIVSLQDEIDYQRQKLNAVKGNAEEEMKIIGQIADLDKQLYDKRLQYSLNYTQKAIDAYRELQKATGQDAGDVHGAGEEVTFERASEDAERARFRQARDLEYIAQHGGTDAQRTLATKQSQDILAQAQEAQTLGKELTAGMKEAFESAKDVLRAASGGQEVRSPGGPSPLVGSILSPAEGLSTETLARGTDIPRLDTSFTDLAIRIRDVLLGTIPNIQNFSNQLATSAKQLATLTLTGNNPGIVGPGGAFTQNPTQGSPPFGSGSSTPAPTQGPGQPVSGATPQIGVSSIGSGGGGSASLNDKLDRLIQVTSDVHTAIITQGTADADNQQQLQNALQQVLDRRTGQDNTVTVDPDIGDKLVDSFTKALA